MERFAGLSLQPRSCTGASAFRFLIVGVLGPVAITTTHCTVHHQAHERGMAFFGWARRGKGLVTIRHPARPNDIAVWHVE